MTDEKAERPPHTCATGNGCKACDAMVARWKRDEDERTDAALQKAFDDGRRSGWDGACSAVADAVTLETMLPRQPTSAELATAANVLARVRARIEEVERRGPPQQKGLD